MAAAATGVFRSPFSGEFDFLTPLCYALGAAVIAAVGLRAITTRPSVSFWAILAALLVLFAAPAFAPEACQGHRTRPATSSRES